MIDYQSQKVKTWSDLASLLAPLRSKHQRLVLATGCFDILHTGHIQLFRKAKKMGDILIVGANSDSSITQIKGPQRPFIKQANRLLNIAAIIDVDYVTSFEELTPVELIKEIKPDIFVKGGDWSGQPLPEEEVIRAYGGQLVFAPIDGIKFSSTSIAEEFFI